ncbi:MAG: Gfo/Idh/MocA family oxidoreductase [Solirubrobacterales bacterium]|nr:Gfo/Idh/MocA family oxidoreductase [Solirubrobacterales bacterium]
MSRRDVGIGLVGYGTMGKAHSYAYAAAPLIRPLPWRPRLRVVAGRNHDAVERAARDFGAERFTTDWREVVEAPDVEIVDICTPPGAHAEVIEAAAEAGKAILCEKPLAADWDDACRAAAAVRRAPVKNAIGFNYRRLPALSLMKELIDSGRIGAIRLWRGSWLSDEFADPEIPFDWRFARREGASTIADLGAHLLDLAGWMVGELDAVSAQSQTFTPARADAAGERHDVDIDEASSALLRFTSGALGVFEVGKTCVRRPCDFTLEVNGERGTLRFDYARINELWFGDGDDAPELYGMRRIRAEHPLHPETRGWWAIGQGIGYGASFVNQIADLLERWPDGRWAPDFAVGLEVQAACEAIERAAAERRWVTLEEIRRGPAVGTAGSPR